MSSAARPSYSRSSASRSAMVTISPGVFSAISRGASERNRGMTTSAATSRISIETRSPNIGSGGDAGQMAALGDGAAFLDHADTRQILVGDVALIVATEIGRTHGR